MRNISAATRKPGNAATTKGARQSPNAVTSGPMVKNAAISPSGKPSMKKPERPRAPLRREKVADQRIGRRRVARLADPDPHARHQERPEAPGEGVRRGKALQIAIPHPITCLREPRSASRPSGSPATA